MFSTILQHLNRSSTDECDPCLQISYGVHEIVLSYSAQSDVLQRKKRMGFKEDYQHEIDKCSKNVLQKRSKKERLPVIEALMNSRYCLNNIL
jgi:hypothetical protein